MPSAGDGVTNDGRCDPLGRLWIGTVDRSGARRAGLYCVGADGSVMTVRGGVGLSNGLDWSPDGSVCHYVDSFAGRSLMHRLWNFLTRLNTRHNLYAWISLFSVIIADLYVRLVATGVIHDLRFM